MESLLSIRINKAKTRKAVKNQIAISLPELYSRVTDRIVNDMLVFVEGYQKCLNNFKQEPINEKEVMELIIMEAVNYVTERITKEKK